MHLTDLGLLDHYPTVKNLPVPGHAQMMGQAKWIQRENVRFGSGPLHVNLHVDENPSNNIMSLNSFFI